MENRHFLHVPIDFEPFGSQIVLYDPEQDYSELDTQPDFPTSNPSAQNSEMKKRFSRNSTCPAMDTAHE